MPLGDRTGPAGQGPMTGRRAGYCVGYNVPGYLNPLGASGNGTTAIKPQLSTALQPNQIEIVLKGQANTSRFGEIRQELERVFNVRTFTWRSTAVAAVVEELPEYRLLATVSLPPKFPPDQVWPALTLVVTVTAASIMRGSTALPQILLGRDVYQYIQTPTGMSRTGKIVLTLTVLALVGLFIGAPKRE